MFDCYLEAYHHVYNRDEKRSLAQVLTDVMHKRPRFDFKAEYFIKSYRMECVTLRLHASLIKSILDKQVCQMIGLTLSQQTPVIIFVYPLFLILAELYILD